MPAATPKTAMARPVREYPTEWSWYADEEKNEQNDSREEQQDEQTDTVTRKPQHVARKSA